MISTRRHNDVNLGFCIGKIKKVFYSDPRGLFFMKGKFNMIGIEKASGLKRYDGYTDVSGKVNYTDALSLSEISGKSAQELQKKVASASAVSDLKQSLDNVNNSLLAEDVSSNFSFSSYFTSTELHAYKVGGFIVLNCNGTSNTAIESWNKKVVNTPQTLKKNTSNGYPRIFAVTNNGTVYQLRMNASGNGFVPIRDIPSDTEISINAILATN